MPITESWKDSVQTWNAWVSYLWCSWAAPAPALLESSCNSLIAPGKLLERRCWNQGNVKNCVNHNKLGGTSLSHAQFKTLFENFGKLEICIKNCTGRESYNSVGRISQEEQNESPNLNMLPLPLFFIFPASDHSTSFYH